MITNVRIFPLSKPHKSIAANASFQIDNFVVKCRVMKGPKGLFVSLPSKQYEKDGKTEYADEVFPVTKDARMAMNQAVLNAYQQSVSGTPTSQGESEGPTNQENIPF